MRHLFTFFLCLISLLTFSQKDNSREGFPKTITVTGSADIEYTPDEIYVQVELTEFKKKGEEKVELEKIKNDFLIKCKSIGIPDSIIRLGSYLGYSTYKKKKKDVELYNSVIYQIKFSESKKIDELMKVLDDDATSIFKVGRVSHSKISDFRKQLKINAIIAAKEKAIYLAEAIGEKVGDAISIYEPNEKSTYFENANYSSLGSNSVTVFTEGEQIEGIPFKKVKLRYEVEVVFALK
ncbi:MAG: SIMPL domain-containing protein [Ferruginibacter sp.]|nr:SIMPL domain-containing protein [Ferruginibacter sp.]